MPLDDWLSATTKQLSRAGIESARLDSLILLSDELERNKAWLLANPEHILTATQQIRLAEKVARREKREPLAYIREKQEFYRREFLTTNNVLVPRPETEALLSLLLSLPNQAGDKLIDVGTGSGVIAVTAKLELPGLDTYATDIDSRALSVATTNAERLQAEITFARSDLLTNIEQKQFKFITANLPYVVKGWKTSPEIDFEPSLALFAEDEGLALIKKLIVQAKDYLAPDGYLLLEADPCQHSAILEYALSLGYALHQQIDFIVCLKAGLHFYSQG
jgi:release factor glutamine methyltransferase